MTTNLNQAKEQLFGKDGLAVMNIKLFPGSDRDATAEDVAGEVVRILTAVSKGDFEKLEI